MASADTRSDPIEDAELPSLFDLIEPDWRLMLAVSGGADSVALMVLMRRWIDRGGAVGSVDVVTVDHGLRPQSADEASQVAEWARAIGFPCDIRAWRGDKPAGNVQAEARRARYRLIAEAARDKGASHVVTAHHLDDQAETFLMRLARGSGVYGLGGMQPLAVVDGLTIARPLISVAKSRLVATLHAAGHPWIEDPTNADPSYLRTRTRQVMPQLAALGMTAERLAQTAARLARAARAIDSRVAELLAERTPIEGVVALQRRALLREDEEVALRAMATAIARVTGADYVPRLEQIEALLADLADRGDGRGDGARTLAGAVVAWDHQNVFIYREAGRAGFPVVEVKPGARACWDGRYHVGLAKSCEKTVAIRALGADGRRSIAVEPIKSLPNRAVESLLSVWCGETLVAVPALDHYVSREWESGICVEPSRGPPDFGQLETASAGSLKTMPSDVV